MDENFFKQKRQEAEAKVQLYRLLEENPDLVNEIGGLSKTTERTDLPSEIKIKPTAVNIKTEKAIKAFMEIPDSEMTTTQVVYKIFYENQDSYLTMNRVVEILKKRIKIESDQSVFSIISKRFTNGEGLLRIGTAGNYQYKVKSNYVFHGHSKKSEKFDLKKKIHQFLKKDVSINDTFKIQDLRELIIPKDSKVHDTEIAKCLQEYLNSYLRIIEINPSIYKKHLEIK